MNAQQQQATTSSKMKFESLTFDHLYALADKRQLTNPKFSDADGNPLLYSDNDDFDLDEGRRFRLFATRDVKRSFHEWPLVRKSSWKSRRKHVYIAETPMTAVKQRDKPISTSHDFWLASGFELFDQWLLASKAAWRRNYSWHKNKKRKLQSETEKELHYPSLLGPLTSGVAADVALHQFNDWLEVRKQQWRITRRKRQLERNDSISDVKDVLPNQSDDSVEKKLALSQAKSKRLSSNDTHHAPLDISWIFDSDVGAPDDVIVLLMRFLNPSDHGNLLCLSWASNYCFKKRDAVWQSLCPKRWILPRRPRKSW
jgi:hypothetical protein